MVSEGFTSIETPHGNGAEIMSWLMLLTISLRAIARGWKMYSGLLRRRRRFDTKTPAIACANFAQRNQFNLLDTITERCNGKPVAL